MRDLPTTLVRPGQPTTVEPAGPETLATLLPFLESEVAAAGYPTTLLRPGLSPDHVHARLATIGLTPGPEIATWFAWHDGADGDPHQPAAFLLPTAGALLPREVAVDLYRVDQQQGWACWSHGWLRLFDTQHSIGARCTPDGPQHVARISSNTHFGEIDEPAITESLASPVTWWTPVLRTPTTVYHRDVGRWDDDYQQIPVDIRSTRLM